jgi:hypothetical protein
LKLDGIFGWKAAIDEIVTIDEPSAMLTATVLLRSLAVAAIVLVVLQQADRGIWWHLCQFRGIRKRLDTEQLYLAGKAANKFLVPTKVVPAVLASIAAGWMTAVDQAIGGLLLWAAAVIAFVIASALHAYKTLWQLNGR